jgi:hypothetical protein
VSQRSQDERDSRDELRAAILSLVIMAGIIICCIMVTSSG